MWQVFDFEKAAKVHVTEQVKKKNMDSFSSFQVGGSFFGGGGLCVCV